MVLAGVGGGEQFVAEEDAVGARVQAERLEFVGNLGSAGGESDDGARHGDAGCGDGAHEVEAVEWCGAVEWCAGYLDEEVDRDAFGVRVQDGKLVDEPGSDAACFAHADDASAADFDLGDTDGGEGVETVLVGARRDDRGVEVGVGV